MKKLMIAAAIVCAAAMSQAAAVTWSSGSSKLVDKDNNVLTAVPDGGSIVLAVIGNATTDMTDWNAGSWSATKDSLTELQTGTVTASGKAANIGKVNMSYEFAYASSKIADGDILAAIIKDAEGNYSQLTYQADGSAVTDTLKVSGLAEQQGLYSGTLAFASEGNFMAQSVPEPTSAMLLLLGVAGLALRRRRA